MKTLFSLVLTEYICTMPAQIANGPGRDLFVPSSASSDVLIREFGWMKGGKLLPGRSICGYERSEHKTKRAFSASCGFCTVLGWKDFCGLKTRRSKVNVSKVPWLEEEVGGLLAPYNKLSVEDCRDFGVNKMEISVSYSCEPRFEDNWGPWLIAMAVPTDCWSWPMILSVSNKGRSICCCGSTSDSNAQFWESWESEDK